MALEKTIVFLGAGSMAEALIAGVLNKGVVAPHEIIVTNRQNRARLAELANRYGVRTANDKREAVREADVIVLAMKPKDVSDALNEVADRVRANHLIISVAAGVPIAFIQSFVPHPVPIVRTMPNTSCHVGLSATGIALGPYAAPCHETLVRKLFDAIGMTCVVKEEQLDAVTGLSGSGPAYIYFLVEAMEQAGQQAGLAPEIARRLTVQTLLGAAHMLLETREEPSVLREKVTSPGGTTMAGLEVLRTHRFQEAIQRAVLRATERARELGQIVNTKAHSR